MKPATLFSAVMVGTVTASVGIVGPAAFADQDYPSWNDVQKAKQSEATKRVEIDKITALLAGLQAASTEASKASLIAAEAYRVTQDQLDAATARESNLIRQTDAAQARADTSKMRAGLISAHLAKAGAQDLSLNLFLNGNSANDLLHQLGTASKLAEQSETIYRQAVQDKNTAESLAEQAASAQAERARLTAESKATFDKANAAAQAAQAALEAEQKKSSELYEQLALLKDTTAEAERAYQTGVDAVAAAVAFAQAQAAAAAKAAAAAEAADPVPSDSGSDDGGSSGGSSGSSGGASSGGYVPVPNTSAVNTALGFARAQLGDRYLLNGYGPDVWDCSGLTKASYAAAGIYIGTHSATNQYNTMAGQGRLVSFSQVQAGDLVFWGSPGNYYHVALYVGDGQVLEAPNPSQPVRVHSIWSSGDVASYVGRPSA